MVRNMLSGRALAWGNIKGILRNMVITQGSNLVTEIAARIFLLMLFIHADFEISSGTIIQPEQMWKYRYPLKDSVVPYGHLLVFIFISTTVIIFAFGNDRRYKNIPERRQATLAFTLSIFLAGVVINYMKLWIGRPRPNYLARCYGMPQYLNVIDPSSPCTDSTDWVGDKTKSFPSGHSGTAFSAFVFQSLYIAGKLGLFNSSSKAGPPGKGWRVLVSGIPIFAAVWVACTRFTDYHHHVEDIMIGSLIGTVIAYLSYRLYYPSLDNAHAEFPSIWFDLGFTPVPKNGYSCLREADGEEVTFDQPKDAYAQASPTPVVSTSNNALTPANSWDLKCLYFKGGQINAEVRMSRVHPTASTMETPTPATVSFVWDTNSDGSFEDRDMKEVLTGLKDAMTTISPS